MLLAADSMPAPGVPYRLPVAGPAYTQNSAQIGENLTRSSRSVDKLISVLQLVELRKSIQ